MNILKNQPTMDNPYIIEDYPYGFTLRTQMRVWIETTKRGQRIARQTLNPKTDKWNNPKKSTYTNVMLAGINEEGHLKTTGVGMYSSKKAAIFLEKYQEFLTDYQKTELTNMIKMLEVYDQVEWKCTARKFKHKETGEISESINLMEFNMWEECDEEGNLIDVPAKAIEEKNNNRRLNQTAVMNAAQVTTIKSATDTFGRC